MSKEPKISVIIVSWNVAQSLKRCLESVFAAKYPNLEVFVIDNASTDDSVKIAKSFAGVKVVANFNNIGFPKAINIGLRQSRGDYILLLNPDARIPKDFFTKALEFTKSHSDIGVMGPKFVDPDGTPQGSVFPEPSLFKSSQKYSPSSPSIVNAISGACMFFPKQTLNKIGLMTEKVFMYYEDLDYCLRIRVTGLKVYFNPNITIIHEHGQSSKKSPLAQKYLWQSSIWYNGPLKHYLMWLISWSGQKFQKLLGGKNSIT
ncbi:MAG: glycosyltransferase [Microgenomates group bacterium Gr01-1014_16]|nr:MAG: glycosyltransferase [Microgenomates group bacterium Gr01-1014_16]